MAVASYRQLLAWQRAMDLVECVYRVSTHFPREEAFGLTNQIRRAAVSIPSNIAEGQGRGEGADFIRFLRIARGSVQEVETQMILAVRLGYVSQPEADDALGTADEVSRLIWGLTRSADPLATRNS